MSPDYVDRKRAIPYKVDTLVSPGFIFSTASGA